MVSGNFRRTKLATAAGLNEEIEISGFCFWFAHPYLDEAEGAEACWNSPFPSLTEEPQHRYLLGSFGKNWPRL
jgi:hypothetical protein